jgi:hypothetical protein
MSQSQRSDSQSQYEGPFPRPSAAVPAATNGQPGQARQERPPACQSRRPPAPAGVRPGSIAAQDPCAATMFLMTGLPGAGKTTRARQLAAAHLLTAFTHPQHPGEHYQHRSRWRRHHQAQSRQSHYQRRLTNQPLPMRC